MARRPTQHKIHGMKYVVFLYWIGFRWKVILNCTLTVLLIYITALGLVSISFRSKWSALCMSKALSFWCWKDVLFYLAFTLLPKNNQCKYQALKYDRWNRPIMLQLGVAWLSCKASYYVKRNIIRQMNWSSAILFKVMKTILANAISCHATMISSLFLVVTYSW